MDNTIFFCSGVLELSESVYPIYQDSIMNELDDFAKLKEGWSYGEGSLIKKSTIDKAKSIYAIGKIYYNSINVFPDTNGSILVVFHNADISIEVTITEYLQLDIAVEKGIGFDYEVISEEEGISLKELEKILNRYKSLGWYENDTEKHFNYHLHNINDSNLILSINNISEWNISEHFNTSILTKYLKDLEVQLFQTPQTGVVYQLWNTNALNKRAKKKMEQYVTTSPSTTKLLLESQ